VDLTGIEPVTSSMPYPEPTYRKAYRDWDTLGPCKPAIFRIRLFARARVSRLRIRSHRGPQLVKGTSIFIGTYGVL
jgi:hypothetical protein